MKQTNLNFPWEKFPLGQQTVKKKKSKKNLSLLLFSVGICCVCDWRAMCVVLLQEEEEDDDEEGDEEGDEEEVPRDEL